MIFGNWEGKSRMAEEDGGKKKCTEAMKMKSYNIPPQIKRKKFIL